jgi:hypothetical protein
MNDPLRYMEEIIDLMIRSKVKESSELTYRKDKSGKITTTYMRYKGEPFLKIVNNMKSVIMYTYKDLWTEK